MAYSIPEGAKDFPSHHLIVYAPHGRVVKERDNFVVVDKWVCPLCSSTYLKAIKIVEKRRDLKDDGISFPQGLVWKPQDWTTFFKVGGDYVIQLKNIKKRLRRYRCPVCLGYLPRICKVVFVESQMHRDDEVRLKVEDVELV